MKSANKNKYSRCTAIDSRSSNCYEQVSVYMNKLLKECLEGVEGVSTDTIHLSDLGFVIFVLAHHQLLVQGTYFRQISLQLSFEAFCFVLGAGDECFLVTNELFSRPDLLFKISQFLFQGCKLGGADRGVSFGIQRRLFLVELLTFVCNIGLQWELGAAQINPLTSQLHP